jgi:hypothetical protein
MIEQIGNLWDFHNKGEWIVITTNGTVKKSGEAVMGRGCALECKIKYPWFSKELGRHLNKDGNVVWTVAEQHILTLPVKHNWWEVADINLIEVGLQRIINIMSIPSIVMPINRLYLPRPGCGNGHLNWEFQVKPLCEKYLDERFIILTK